MPLARQSDYISEQDYLDGEKVGDIRYEYVDGQVFAMAGASKRHNRIGLNIATALDAAGQEQGCEIFTSDIKVRLAWRKTYYYPDVIVSCESDDNDDYYLEHPCLIVEVLSDSTKNKDYQEKLLAYQSIPSLRTYLIVSQNEMNVDCFHKDEQGNWWVSHLKQADDVLELDCPQINLTLEEIYNRVSFPVDSAKENNNGQ